GLANDYVGTLKEILEKQPTERGAVTDAGPYFVTFPNGYALGLHLEPEVLWTQKYPFINLGLCMVGTSSQKNIFGIAHKSAPKRFGFERFDEKRMYVRTLHNINDSHVEVRDKWKVVADYPVSEDIARRLCSISLFRR
ncbi:MAG: putative rhamnosyl transferase, partial [Paracoccaceae bacterium]|nr:putative rhamnosyl transferase [Paracoccaceae bacterium]